MKGRLHHATARHEGAFIVGGSGCFPCPRVDERRLRSCLATDCRSPASVSQRTRYRTILSFSFCAFELWDRDLNIGTGRT